MYAHVVCCVQIYEKRSVISHKMKLNHFWSQTNFLFKNLKKTKTYNRLCHLTTVSRVLCKKKTTPPYGKPPILRLKCFETKQKRTKNHKNVFCPCCTIILFENPDYDSI